MTKKINLKYSNAQPGFFSAAKQMSNIINQSKKDPSISTFNERDDFEIGRGASYAVFPELKEQVSQGKKITVTDFRRSLSERGVTDEAFQNKILNFTLQNKSGIQFAFGKIVDKLMLENDFLLTMNPNFKLNLKVESDQSVSMQFIAFWKDPTNAPEEPAIGLDVKVKITPDQIFIDRFDLQRFSDNPVAKDAMDFLQANQQNILMQLITYIKRVLGFDSELRLEQKGSNDENWVASSTL